MKKLLLLLLLSLYSVSCARNTRVINPEPCHVSSWPETPISKNNDIILCDDEKRVCFTLDFAERMDEKDDRVERWHKQIMACPYVVESKQ